MRRLYATGVTGKDVGYVIVRPGGLTRDEGLGVGSIELNQGDTKSGRIARADVAEAIFLVAGPAEKDDLEFDSVEGMEGLQENVSLKVLN